MSETIKVFELAKELEIAPITLVDKLKGLDIAVKSHMSDVSLTDAAKARDALVAKPKATKKKTAKKKVTKKVAKTVTKKASGTVVKRKAAATPEEPEVKAAPAKTVIRRRTRQTDDGQTIVERRESGLGGAPLADKPVVETITETTTAATVASTTQETVTVTSTATTTTTETITKPVARSGFLTTSVAKNADAIIAEANQRAADKEAAEAPKKAFKKAFSVTKESLNAMVEEEAAKKKRGAGNTRTAGPKPEDSNLSDFYRRKERVFLPKRKRIPVGVEMHKTQKTEKKASKRVVEMQDTITIQDLAMQLETKAPKLIKALMMMGQQANINSDIDFDTASLIAEEFDYQIKNISFKEDEFMDIAADSADSLVDRPPIITVMGHVDHGKTTLLDSIKSTKIVDGEAGGITQHIGAYSVEKNGKIMSFIDTPGHEAFTVMRARGANVTDIVILVVAADDGVMPQTREAVSHAKAAGAPIIVAINKIDKAGANPEKAKQGLAELDLLPEDWGGETMYVEVSALENKGIDKLLEAILLNAEMLELKANPTAPCRATVLEAKLAKGLGPVATILSSRGTLRIGDPIICGQFAGRVRAMKDHLGSSIKELKPGYAAEITGLEGVPGAGDQLDSPESESAAKKIAENRQKEIRLSKQTSNKMSLEELFASVETGDTKELKIILKSDVQGSSEAVKSSLEKLATEKVKINVIHTATGGITESDVLLCSASNAIILGFNVRPETKARQIAEKEGVDIKCYKIIYELLDDVTKAMTGMLDKKEVENFLGRAEVRQVFTVPKIGAIAGSAVIDGKFVRGAKVRLLRDSTIIFEGNMSSLKRFKDDAKEVQTGYECGIGIESYNDIKPGDIIEAYEIQLIAQTLES